MPSVGTHEPQVVPARVHALRAGTVAASPEVMASTSAPLVTALQEQIWAPSGSASMPTPTAPSPAGAMSDIGSPGRRSPRNPRNVS